MADNRMIRLAEDLAKSSGELWSYILVAQLPAGVETGMPQLHPEVETMTLWTHLNHDAMSKSLS